MSAAELTATDERPRGLGRLLEDADTRRIAGFATAIALLAFAVLVWPIPAPLGVIVNGMLVGGRIALDRARHRARVPRQPGRELRPG